MSLIVINWKRIANEMRLSTFPDVVRREVTGALVRDKTGRWWDITIVAKTKGYSSTELYGSSDE